MCVCMVYVQGCEEQQSRCVYVWCMCKAVRNSSLDVCMCMVYVQGCEEQQSRCVYVWCM